MTVRYYTTIEDPVQVGLQTTLLINFFESILSEIASGRVIRIAGSIGLANQAYEAAYEIVYNEDQTEGTFLNTALDVAIPFSMSLGASALAGLVLPSLFAAAGITVGTTFITVSAAVIGGERRRPYIAPS